MRIWRDRTYVPSFIRLDFRKIWWKRIGCPCLFSPCLLYGGWCGMAGDRSPGGPLHHGNGCHWKLNVLQQWTQCNSVHCGTLGSIQRVRITWHYKTWNRHHFSIGRDINGSLTYSMHLGPDPDGHCFDSIRLFMPPNLPPVQHTNRCPGLLWGLSVWPLSHFAAMMRHFLEPTLNTFVKKFLPWQFRHCSQGYWSISQKCAMKNLQN